MKKPSFSPLNLSVRDAMDFNIYYHLLAHQSMLQHWLEHYGIGVLKLLWIRTTNEIRLFLLSLSRYLFPRTIPI